MKKDPIGDIRKPGCYILIACLILALAGCAQMQKVKDFFCDPTPAQKETAAIMKAVIDAGQDLASNIFPALKIAKVTAVLETIAKGGCFLADELAEAFEVVDAIEGAKAKAKGLKAPVKDSYPALRKFVK